MKINTFKTKKIIIKIAKINSKKIGEVKVT